MWSGQYLGPNLVVMQRTRRPKELLFGAPRSRLPATSCDTVGGLASQALVSYRNASQVATPVTLRQPGRLLLETRRLCVPTSRWFCPFVCYSVQFPSTLHWEFLHIKSTYVSFYTFLAKTS